MDPKWIDLMGDGGRNFAANVRLRAEPPTPRGIDLDFWPLKSVTDDQSDNAHSGTTASGGPTRTTDNGLYVADFGAGQAVHYPLSVPSEWTIITACKPDSFTNFAHLCGAGPVSASNSQRWGILYMRDTPSSQDGGLRVIWGDGTNASRIDSDDPVFSTSNYLCLGVRFTTGTADVDVLSQFDAITTTVTEGTATTCNPGANNFYIGRGGNYATQPWDGKVARLWVWRKALPDRAFDYYTSQIAAAYCGM